MGVKNAEAVVTQALGQKTKNLNAEKEWLNATTDDLSNATAGEIDNLADEKDWSDETKRSLYKLALQKQTANGIKLNTSGDITNLIGLIKGLGGATKALKKKTKAASLFR